MTNHTQGAAAKFNPPEVFPGQAKAESPGEGASEQTVPSPVQTDKAKQGCAASFITEQRNEMDKLCERSPAEQREEYTQSEEEKEVGGEG